MCSNEKEEKKWTDIKKVKKYWENEEEDKRYLEKKRVWVTEGKGKRVNDTWERERGRDLEGIRKKKKG